MWTMPVIVEYRGTKPSELADHRFARPEGPVQSEYMPQNIYAMF